MSAELKSHIEKSGFSTIGCFDPAKLEIRPEVREMCAADKCHEFGKNWMCPPACGSLEKYQTLLKRYHTGYLFQTVAEMEDAFDYPGIEEGSRTHQQRLNDLVKHISHTEQDILLLGAGACKLCEPCTYPNAPCRNPKRAIPSMEATGLVVYDVCELANIPYYHGPNTIAYCSCALE
ncbi:MAG: DUF2284 domain-containing protein [Coriobacteriales bacterium]|jgi:predicted metal-binding protein|nr:DUF2284 domain-containing protein [Coriobacteriales bacterium]